MSGLSLREQRIVGLLRALDDANAVAAREGVRRTDDGSVQLQPHAATCRIRTSNGRLVCTCWLRSIRELQRCLSLMRQGQETRRLWYQVHERYVAAQRKPTLVQVRRGRPLPEANVEVIGLVNRLSLNHKGDGVTRVLAETWRAGLKPELVDAGVRWLASEFRGMPELPVEKKEAA